jgi:bifunctional UDP-N-acetylglucosamine pyrophosphorylase/glucosamine-1-phosphate N-acetyltransferase
MHMLAGVALEDPASTLIEPTVALGRDVIIGANVQLRGRCLIEDDARIDANTVVIDSLIERGAHVKSFSHLEGARVGRGALIGPFARLRPQADIGANAHIGNFVEVKKSVVEAGAKANHLAYLGDARVGSKANIGAGTICCNYDGSGKHPTDIGAGVFIGSNSTLVAPISVGDGAYVAAGSTLTRDVPADALAIGRARQENKERVAARLRARIRARASGTAKK